VLVSFDGTGVLIFSELISLYQFGNLPFDQFCATIGI